MAEAKSNNRQLATAFCLSVRRRSFLIIRMDCAPLLALWINDRFFGIEWYPWKVVGWVGNIIFFSRFFVQWLASEKHQRVVIPPIFWWLSLMGSLCLLAYGLYRKDSVFIFAYAFTWIPYIRNLIIGSRENRAQLQCLECNGITAPPANFCPTCGCKLAAPPVS